MWTKLLLLLIIRVLLKGNIATELQFMSLIIVQMEPSFATLTPSPVITSSLSTHVTDSSNANSVESASNVQGRILAQKRSSESKIQYYNRGKI